MLKFTREPDYEPNKLLNYLRDTLGVKNDAQLALKLELQPTQIAKMRAKTDPISAVLLVRASEMLDMPTKELKSIARA